MKASTIKKALIKLLETAPDDADNTSLEGLALLGIAALLTERKDIDTVPQFSELVQAFHNKFNQTYDDIPRPLPDILEWRITFLKEELLKELIPAVRSQDMVKQFDALLDIMYLCMGQMIMCGFPIFEGFWEVHTSNMSKTLVEPGKGKYGGTVDKGMGYRPPNLKLILDRRTQQVLEQQKESQ